MAVVTTGNGGYDRLEYKSISIPVPASDEVLLRVLAFGVNNTEINTRLGWYSSSVEAVQIAFRSHSLSTKNTKQMEAGTILRLFQLFRVLTVVVKS